MAVKPRKKEPTLAELLAQYGRNIASDVPVVGRRIAEGVRSLPEMADTGSRFALGAAQRLGDMLPPELRGPALRGDYRTTFDAGVDTAQLLGRAGNQLVTGTSQRGLDAMGAPRGAGYDPGATRMSRGAQDAVVSGAQALPKQMYDNPLSTAYEAALMAAPIPGKMVGRALEGAGALAGRAMRGRRAAPLAAAVEDVAPMPQGMLALPAPERMLALPAPGPGLPPGAAKLRGGQWWAIKDFDGANYSPEAAARTHALDFELSGWVPEGQGVAGGRIADTSPASTWLERAMTKYYKNDFGSPDDPLRALAERGMHYDPEMTPERWQQTVNDILQEDTIGSVLLPRNPKGGMPGAGDDLRANAMLSMPWLAKLPVTDKIYGIGGGGLDLRHFTDEFLNALNPEASGLPLDLAVRPESLGRMTFPQAVEQVGKINQYRAKEMERAALSSASNPAVQTFKEYSENNPTGLRWTELKAPEGTINPNRAALAENSDDWLDPGYTALRDALKYEGDTMGHCVGGYCDDVMSGRSRIFSLRDAKGEPHVTIETAPGDQSEIYRQAIADLRDTEYWPAWVQNQQESIRTGNFGGTRDLVNYMNEFRTSQGLEPVGMDIPNDIVQIKGKQNRAPKDDYLPFVQDFVKGQKWGNVGDLRNTGLVKLPDGRYITRENYQQVIDDNRLDEAYKSYDFNAHGFPGAQGLDDDAWQQFQRHFEGYAVGGRVSADRCFSRHPMSVR